MSRVMLGLKLLVVVEALELDSITILLMTRLIRGHSRQQYGWLYNVPTCAATTQIGALDATAARGDPRCCER
jgi:hypothetical protein